MVGVHEFFNTFYYLYSEDIKLGRCWCGVLLVSFGVGWQ